MNKFLFSLFACFGQAWACFAQTDTNSINKSLQEVVVTATRNEQLLNKVPVPVTIINKQQIKDMGAVLLSQVLSEQTGLFLSSNHGTGIQMQGLESEYTLILLDGEPLIGRTAGTFDLSRIAVGNIERIEIIKGPVSSLYGSDALAGVINIITKNRAENGSTTLSGRYGSNGTYNGDINSVVLTPKSTIQSSANLLGSNGYTLGDDKTSPTIAPYHAATLQGRWQYQINNRWQSSVSGRWYNQQYKSYFTDQAGKIDDKGKEQDMNASWQLRYQQSERFTQLLRFYYSRYHTDENMWWQSSKELYDASYFTQQYFKPEYQADLKIAKSHLLTAGGGYVRETVSATRYDDQMAFNTGYLFIQDAWQPTEKWNIVLGGRYDMHNQYPSQFSPKLALSYNLSPTWRIMGSVGRGYRAPDFRQLYLHFNNAAVGYTVAGTKLATEIINDLTARGQIKRLTVDPSQLNSLNAERSWAFNVAAQGKLAENATAKVNLFYNSVSDMIDTRAIAEKTNGQYVFSYVNLQQITTCGSEVELNYSLNQWMLSGGYQYLRTKDNAIYDQVKAGKVYTTDENTKETRVLRRNEYFGLFNRSRHNANLKIAWTSRSSDWNANVRAIYRSKYGFTDENGNNVPDLKSEFVPGYLVTNLALSKQFFDKRMRVQGTVENLFNYSDYKHIPTMPGRLYTVAVSWTIQHTNQIKQ
ncbi:TonB-dependent receptor [Chitinophaga silvatica]|uniref:TonB-dependent receptor n=1 Tax=Chitinophaga silvatica TaxID=2282649 RepID=A0A3E1Y6X5_9BACT|nr:TonB-dependent receptor [Chitinophaga silvatica]RFS20694.1 TonB-dependent receptor [Chitinophaga silvatica]